ncbi:GNAT family N-acetyltransferase [Pantanalinema sp. GBBB05]|uniref:GNAT family N-acetyltransferase n=1 Tax=Pantanalinema sp. GBBB05 TaxID=2604139 RepID=UPI001DB78758|nr:GNAT family N-acetyltransferase [Pantanalinema sp. GBBB05]
MAERIVSLPSCCSIRPAQLADQWALQEFVLKLIWTEALAFDLRMLAYRLVRLVALGGAIVLELWLLEQTTTQPGRWFLFLLLLYSCGVTFFSGCTLLLYLLLIPTEPLFNWSLYHVVECNGLPVGCAALSCYSEFYVLYHLFVSANWRQQSLGACLVQHLIQKASQPVYLVCKPKLQWFYTRLGFHPVTWKELAPPVQAHFSDFELDRRISGATWKVMCYSP